MNRLSIVLLPYGSKRRNFLRLLIRSKSILLNEGPIIFFIKINNFKNRVLFNRNKLDDYSKWILNNKLNKDDLKKIINECNNFKYSPKISIIVPVYNPNVKWINAAINSVLNQAYENWELCIADASTKEDVKKSLKRYSEKDKRIKVKFLKINNGISENSNEALNLATGEYVGLLDHDDELSQDALYEVVKCLQADPDIDMMYSDEDKIDLKGNRTNPFFKPDWSPDLFLSCMYTCHFGVYRKKLVDKIGGFRKKYDGSQDYDLVLRIIENTNNIHHIPKILYHWKTVEGSVASGMDNKPYAYNAIKNALTDYLERSKIKGVVLDGLLPNVFYVKRDLLKNSLVSIIIPTKDNVFVLKKCVDSILNCNSYSNYEILIIDNNSVEEDTKKYFKQIELIPNIKIIKYSKTFNFSAINNFAVKQAQGEIILFLNNDTETINDNWLIAMLEHVQRKEVGAVGCKLLYPNNTVQHGGVILGISGLAGHSHKGFKKDSPGYFGRLMCIQNLSAVTAGCMLIRKEVFEEVGGFEEDLEVAFNDVDLCLKIRAKGYLIVYTPYAELYHYESLSRGRGDEDTPEKQKRFLKEIQYMKKKWGKVIDKGDPYYNINLTLKREDFGIEYCKK